MILGSRRMTHLIACWETQNLRVEPPTLFHYFPYFEENYGPFAIDLAAVLEPPPTIHWPASSDATVWRR